MGFRVVVSSISLWAVGILCVPLKIKVTLARELGTMGLGLGLARAEVWA